MVHVLSPVSLFCHPMDCSPPGSSVHGLFQARTLKWVALLLQGIVMTRINSASPVSPTLAGEFFTIEPPGKPIPYNILS